MTQRWIGGTSVYVGVSYLLRCLDVTGSALMGVLKNLPAAPRYLRLEWRSIIV